MRVPIYTADLSVKRGFKRIAKKLQKNWPCATPLSLASAHAILSRGLGYRDFHDIQQSTQESHSNAPTASQNEARDRISASIFAFCKANKIIGIEVTDLDRLVNLLPLQELQAFRGFNPERPANFCAPIAPDTSLARELSDSPNTHRDNHGGQPTNLGLKLRDSVPPIKLIDKKGLKFLWEVVQRRGNLRDQSCFALLLLGLRPNDFKLAKPHDFSDFNSGVRMHIQFAKARLQHWSVVLPGSVGDVVGRYIKEAGLSENDYLFPSEENANVPMSSYKMNTIIGSYLREALSDPAQRSVHRIRHSVIANTIKPGALSVSDLMGHSSPKTIIDYISGLKKKPKK